MMKYGKTHTPAVIVGAWCITMIEADNAPTDLCYLPANPITTLLMAVPAICASLIGWMNDWCELEPIPVSYCVLLYFLRQSFVDNFPLRTQASVLIHPWTFNSLIQKNNTDLFYVRVNCMTCSQLSSSSWHSLPALSRIVGKISHAA